MEENPRVALSCCYEDCIHPQKILEPPSNQAAGTVTVCSCDNKRLIRWELMNGELQPVPIAQRFDPETGRLLVNDLPWISQFRGESRGGPGMGNPLNSAVFPTGEPFAIPDAMKSQNYNIKTVPPPIVIGDYIVHRTFSSDRWYFWSRAKGNKVFEVLGGEGLNLAAAPVGDGCGIGLLAAPDQFHRYAVVPTPDETPDITRLPANACPNAAPLITAQTKTPGSYYEIRRVFIAAETGLFTIDLNQPTSPNQGATAQAAGTWNRDPQFFWSPVFFADRTGSGSSAVVTFHADGWVYITWLSKTLAPIGQDSVCWVDHEGEHLLPPAVTSEGLWCLRLEGESSRISRIESPDQLLREPIWKTSDWHLESTTTSGMEAAETWAWTPVIAGGRIQRRGNSSQSQDGKVVYLGNKTLVFVDKDRFNLSGLRSQSIIRAETYPEGFRTNPAFVEAQGHQIFMADDRTGKWYVLNVNILDQRKWRQSGALDPAIRNALVGGPVWMGDSVVLPTLKGLHTIPILR